MDQPRDTMGHNKNLREHWEVSRNVGVKRRGLRSTTMTDLTRTSASAATTRYHALAAIMLLHGPVCPASLVNGLAENYHACCCLL
jgi:hypothetical protein